MFNHTPSEIILPTLQESYIAGKRHYTTPEKNKYPSITTVLGGKEKPAIQAWRTMLGDKKADRETKRCTDRGTAIHELVEKYLNNEQKFTKGYAAEYVRGFNQLKFLLNRVDNIRAQEVALYSDTLGVAGRVDCVAEYAGTLAIVDFKTSTRSKYKDMIDDYFKQTTAYAIMWHELTGEPIDKVVILMSVEKGIMPLVFEDSIENWVAPLLSDINRYKKRQG